MVDRRRRPELMHHLGVHVPVAMLDQLDRLRYRTGEPVSEHVRRAIERYLQHLGATKAPEDNPSAEKGAL